MGGRLTSPLRKGSSPEETERPCRRHYLADLQREEEEVRTERIRAASGGGGGGGCQKGGEVRRGLLWTA